MHAKVVSSYKTSLEDELKLEVGDVIGDIHMTGDKYWTGVMRGKRGHFPRDCVKLLLKGIFQYYYASHMFTSNQLYLFCCCCLFACISKNTNYFLHFLVHSYQQVLHPFQQTINWSCSLGDQTLTSLWVTKMKAQDTHLKSLSACLKMSNFASRRYNFIASIKWKF